MVRVFVSSTFDDMHGERDMLNRVVFPELRSRCAQLGQDFVGVDLRWGITAEAIARVGARALCLAEVDACRPFFLALVGDRYGRVPPPDEVPIALFAQALGDPSVPGAVRAVVERSYSLDEAAPVPVQRLLPDVGEADTRALVEFWTRYPPPGGLRDARRSITELEIARALFDGEPVEHGFVYLRRPVRAEAPFAEAFTERDQARREQLSALKERLRAGGGWTVREYESGRAGLRVNPSLAPIAGDESLADQLIGAAEWDQLGPEARDVARRHGVVVVEGLDEFAEQVIADLWAAIQEWREDAPRPPSEIFVGREQALRSLVDFARAGDPPTIVLSGPAGVGKSALLARLAGVCGEVLPEVLVVGYFVGATPGSTATEQMLAELCGELARATGREWGGIDDPAELRQAFRAELAAAAQRRLLLLVVDGVDQLDRQDTTWLAPVPPAGARVIVSAASGPLVDALCARTGAASLALGPLSVGERAQLVDARLARVGKQLSASQRAELIDSRAHPDAGLPLYLVVALHELTVFGSHRSLDDRIRGLPSGLLQLIEQVLARLEQDHTRAVVGQVCGWLAAARSGLLESDLSDLLGGRSIGVWLRLYRALEFYLRQTDERARPHGAGLLGFRFEAFRAAAATRYLASGERRARAHADLESHFRRRASAGGRWLAHETHALDELPYHALRAGRWDALHTTLTDIGFLETKAAAGMVYGLMRDFAETVAAVGAEDETLSALERGLRAEAGVLARNPDTVFQQLWNRCSWGAEGTQLDALLQDWRASKAADPSFRWLRALRPPPESAHGGGVICRGHTNVVFSVAFSPDGSRIVSGARDATARIWSAVDGSELGCLYGHSDQVQSVAFCPPGHRIVTGSGQPELGIEGEPPHDYSVRVWDAEAAVELARFRVAGMVSQVEVTPDGEELYAVDADGWVHHFGVRDLSQRGARHLGERGARSFALSPDGRLLFAAMPEAIMVLDSRTLTELRRLPGPEFPLAIACSPDGWQLAVSAISGEVTIVDSATGGLRRELAIPGAYDLCWLPDGERLAAALGDATVGVWATAGGGELERFRGHEGPATAVAVDPDATMLASGSMDGTVRTWLLGSSKAGGPSSGHTAMIHCVARSMDGRWFASGSEDGIAVVWDRDGRARHVLAEHGHSVISIAFALGGELVLTGSYDKRVRVWDVRTGELLAALAGKPLMPASIAVAPDGRVVAFPAAGDPGVQIVDLHTRVVREPTMLSEMPSLIRFSPDGSALAAVDGLRGGAAVVEVATGTVVRAFEAPAGAVSIALTAGAERVAVGGLGEILLTDARGERRLSGHGHLVSELAFTPEGALIVSAAEDGTLRIWSCLSGLCVAVLDGGRDAAGLASGDPWLARVRDTGDFELLSLDTFERAASFPALLGNVVSLADLRTYVGVTRAPHVHALRLEGRVDPARPLLQRAVSLATSWRALARLAFEQGDVDAAIDLIRHWGMLCHEFGDEAGLQAAAEDLAALDRLKSR